TPVVRVRVTDARGPLARVIVAAGARGAETDSAGVALLRPAAGAVTVTVRRLGLAPDSARFEARAGMDTTISFVLRAQAAVIAPIVVSSTRTERRVEDEPLRVEVLAGEDIGEKTEMRPADLRVLLTEMPGVRIQTTSPSLGAASVRVQGLRGRYTRILTDGLPLYGAQTGSFGLLQIPPLDLRQAEVIKGAASALYGQGALGGVLNLISRRTPDSSEVLANQTARQGSDVVLFDARQLRPGLGITTLAGAHLQRAVDVNGDGWSDVPGFRRLELRPRLFASDSGGRALMLTAGAFVEDRAGGSVTGASTGGVFPESLGTRHADVGGTLRTRIGSALTVAGRFAGNVQERARRFGVRRELEHTSSAFGELTTTVVSGAYTLLAGVAAELERYRNGEASRFNEDRATPAVFVQHTWIPSDWLATQVNGRCDASSTYGAICTPRVSLLAHSGRVLSARLSGGAGWGAPSAGTEETEVFGLSPVVGPLRLTAERARTLSLDVSTVHGPLEVSGTLFASRVDDPVGLRRVLGDTAGAVELVNASGPARAHGAELFAVYNQEPVIVTAFYGAIRTRETSPETGRLRESPYVPTTSAGLDAAFEEDESGTRVGVEVLYTGRQAVEENPYRTVAPAYVTVGLLVSQRFARANVFLNLENLTNVRQTRWDPLLRSMAGEGGRRTVDEWAPLEGRAANLGVRVRL
ncbi:MAG: TonB-dependent receptor plug, partial [Gemmatimonadetes bacterium]|nr:TonB-dependent receptor plug [Gemmatimonadota bacterium]